MKAVLIAIAATTTVLVAGCGTQTTGTGPSGAPAAAGSTTGTGEPSASPSTSLPPPPTTTPNIPPRTPPVRPPENPDQTQRDTRCHTPELAGSLRQLDSSAGHRYAVLILTNVSRRTCTVYGYGGIQLATASRQPVPTIQRRDRTHPPSPVRLVPGGKASTLLAWGVVPTGREPVTGPCEQTPSLLLVIPPDETTRLAVPWRFGAVCGYGAITQWAYTAGIVNP